MVSKFDSLRRFFYEWERRKFETQREQHKTGILAYRQFV